MSPNIDLSLVYFSPLYLYKVFCIWTHVHCFLFCHSRGPEKCGFIFFISSGEVIEEGSNCLHSSRLKTKQTLLSQTLVECHVLWCHWFGSRLQVPFVFFFFFVWDYILFFKVIYLLFFILMPEYPKLHCKTCICLCWISQGFCQPSSPAC